jgi:S-adenosylmethionine hydrolase
LASGIAPAEFGPEIHDATKPAFAKVTTRNGRVIGEVLHVDSFGNIITNIKAQELANIHVIKVVAVEFPNCTLKLKFCVAYGETKSQEPLALIGSHGWLEIAINQGNAAKIFKIRTGDKVAVAPA